MLHYHMSLVARLAAVATAISNAAVVIYRDKIL
jgi:hypothetical protein